MKTIVNSPPNPLGNASAAFGQKALGTTKAAEALNVSRTIKAIGHVGTIIGLGLTLRSLIENVEQNDDAWIADALAFGSAALGALGTACSAATVTALLVAAPWLILASTVLAVLSYLASLVYTDDKPLETWLNNGPFNQDKADRFGGHQPGSNLTRHTYALDPEPGTMVPTEAGKKRNAYRYALWCEKPDDASMALMDALYRPQVIAKEVMLNQISQIQLHIYTPFLLPTSKLYIQFKREEFSSNTGGQPFKGELESWSIATGEQRDNRQQEGTAIQVPTVEELKTGDNHYTIERINHFQTACDLQVRLDLYGDSSYCLPFEPAFAGNDIGTDDSGNRWVGVTQVFDKPRRSNLGSSTFYSDTPATI